MAATDARNLSYNNLEADRVKYDLEYDSINNLYRFKGKPPEEIKVLDSIANDVFFDSGDDYSPIWFDSSTLEYNYADQAFFDVVNNKNLVVLSEAVTGDCLEAMNIFVNYEEWLLATGFWNDNGVWMDGRTWID